MAHTMMRAARALLLAAGLAAPGMAWGQSVSVELGPTARTLCNSGSGWVPCTGGGGGTVTSPSVAGGNATSSAPSGQSGAQPLSLDGNGNLRVIDPISTPGTYAAPSTAARTIQAASTYQTLFAAGAITHGLTCQNTSASTSQPIYIDLSGATGTTLSGAAQAIGPSTGSTPVGAGGFSWMLPVANAVTIYSATAGATLACAGS